MIVLDHQIYLHQIPSIVLQSFYILLKQAIWYYAMVRFRTIDLKWHPIEQFEENRKIREKMLNSSKVNNEF